MKWKLYVLAFAILLFSSYHSSFANRRGSTKIWVFFHGRPYLQEQRPSPQSAGFTIASMQRRELRGARSFEESDYPVDARFVRALQAAGAEVLRESRWLNAVSVRCNDACNARIASLPFVESIRGVATFRRANEPIELAETPQLMTSALAPPLNYGSSRDQLVQMKVPVAHQRGFAGKGEIVAIFDSGFFKDHIALRNHVIVAERDFVFNDTNVSNDTFTDSHGTGTWSCVGGASPGQLYGPAYQAKFILAATEDIRSETQVEEDNWVAAMEWADQQGAGIISSSLGYSDWYMQRDYDGTTPVTSRAASTAAKKGILVVNSAGNEGPGDSTLTAPADAFDILSAGAIDGGGGIADFSSRGPTADGRVKPEVVARGVSAFVASSFSENSYGRSSGTSFACPLIAGFSAVLFSAHPDWTPFQVREAVMKTASRKDNPDNTFGYGIPNMALALDYLPLASVVIDHKPLKNTTNPNVSYRVNARIRAQRGLNTSQLFLFWKAAGTGKFRRVSLTPVPGAVGRFQGLIPAQHRGTSIVYYLTAKDVQGKVSKSPFQAPKFTHSFSVN